jgi:hypothetical protein
MDLCVSLHLFAWTERVKRCDYFRLSDGNPQCNATSSEHVRAECVLLFTVAGSNECLRILIGAAETALTLCLRMNDRVTLCFLRGTS